MYRERDKDTATHTESERASRGLCVSERRRKRKRRGGRFASVAQKTKKKREILFDTPRVSFVMCAPLQASPVILQSAAATQRSYEVPRDPRYGLCKHRKNREAKGGKRILGNLNNEAAPRFSLSCVDVSIAELLGCQGRGLYRRPCRLPKPNQSDAASTTHGAGPDESLGSRVLPKNLEENHMIGSQSGL